MEQKRVPRAARVVPFKRGYISADADGQVMLYNRRSGLAARRFTVSLNNIAALEAPVRGVYLDCFDSLDIIDL